MRYDDRKLDRIYAKTAGRCHLCKQAIVRAAYGDRTRRGGWEVDHCTPRARGGSEHGNNLKPAHIRCNRSKRDCSTSSMRRRNGVTRAPVSASVQSKRYRENVVGGATFFGVLGLLVGGPAGLLWGSGIGAVVGTAENSDD